MHTKIENRVKLRNMPRLAPVGIIALSMSLCRNLRENMRPCHKKVSHPEKYCPKLNQHIRYRATPHHYDVNVKTYEAN